MNIEGEAKRIRSTVETVLIARVRQLEAEILRIKNIDHRQILAESAAKHLLDSGAENFVGDVFTIKVDGDLVKFEIIVTTQKVGGKSPGEVCSDLKAENDKLKALASIVCNGYAQEQGHAINDLRDLLSNLNVGQNEQNSNSIANGPGSNSNSDRHSDVCSKTSVTKLFKPADQQGEPVGFASELSIRNLELAMADDLEVKRWPQSFDDPVPLYLHAQPPTAKVVLPERRDEDPGQSDADYNSDCGWNACIDKVAKLNGGQS